MKDEMATEILDNLYDTIRTMNVSDEDEKSEKVKQYIAILLIQKELERLIERIYLELDEDEKEEINKFFGVTLEYPEYLPVRDVAEILEVTPQMVRRYCADGKIIARQRLKGSGTWLIPSEQFITHPNWKKYVEKKKEFKKQSTNIAEKMLQYLDEDVE